MLDYAVFFLWYVTFHTVEIKLFLLSTIYNIDYLLGRLNVSL